MKELFLKHRLTLLYSSFGIIILLCTCIHLYTNKSVTPDQRFSLTKASYTITVDYSAADDVYFEGYYTADNQDFMLFKSTLPASDSFSSYSIPLELKHSIRNDSIYFKMPSNEEADYQIGRIKLISNFPWTALVTMLAFIAFTAFFLFYFNEKEMDFSKSKLFLFFSGVFIFLEPLFLINPSLIALFYLFAIVFCVMVARDKVVITHNLFIYGSLLLLSFLLMEFFTTSSPLYPLNTGCDSNAYYATGSALAHGRNLYSEVFDHKGPALLFLFAFGYILSPTTFWGVWLLEVIALSLDMYFIYKICSHFFTDTISLIVSLFTPFFVLTESTLTSGATCEEFMIPILLGAFLCIVSYVSINDVVRNTTKSMRTFLVLGVLSALIFFSKFNLCVVWIVIAFILWLKLIKESPVRNAIAYCIGWLIITLPTVIYFLCTDGLKTLYHFYIKYNLGYSGITSIRITLAGTIGRIYEALTEHYINALFILIGITVVCISKKYLDIWGKLILVISFLTLCGTTYVGSLSWNYYYTLPAIYAFIGYAVIINLFTNKISESNNNEFSPIALCVILAFGGTFFINTSITSAIITNTEPRVQEVFSQQMELLNVDEEVTVFNLGLLESGFLPTAGKYPVVQYFYLPNSSGEEGAEPYGGQISYLNDARTEFFVWKGFSPDNYPEGDGITANYDYVSTYHTNDDIFYMLYQRKK